MSDRIEIEGELEIESEPGLVLILLDVPLPDGSDVARLRLRLEPAQVRWLRAKLGDHLVVAEGH